jgi:hypothetical protein
MSVDPLNAKFVSCCGKLECMSHMGIRSMVASTTPIAAFLRVDGVYRPPAHA